MLTTALNKIGKYQEIVFRFANELGHFKIGVLNEYGAALNRIEIPFKNNTFNLIKGYEAIDDFKKPYRGVLLAPFPNRIKKGQYTFNEKNYQLPINRVEENNALHGFLYNQPFKLIENKIEGDIATLVLQNKYDQNAEGYPFKFNTVVSYVWNAPYELEVKTTLINKGDFTMPLGLGWHPYFQFPQSINNIALHINTTKQFKVDQYLIPTLKTEPYSSFIQHKKIAQTSFDDCFALNDANNMHTTELIDNDNNIAIAIKQSTKTFKYLQVYTPPNRDCIAIEPMTCIPDSFNNQLGLIKLKPTESYSCSYNINLRVGST